MNKQNNIMESMNEKPSRQMEMHDFGGRPQLDHKNVPTPPLLRFKPEATKNISTLQT